jgi:hypothetical protein
MVSITIKADLLLNTDNNDEYTHIFAQSAKATQLKE